MTRELVITFPQFPETKALITLFTNVVNSQDIKTQLIQANTRYDYSFIDASIITSVEQILASVYKTLLDQENGTVKSKTINSEFILNLSPANGVADSFKKVGLTDKTSNLILVKFLPVGEDESVLVGDLQEIVEGEFVEFSDEVLLSTLDYAKVKKTFKLSQVLDDRDVLSRLIIGLTQLK